MTFLTLDLTQKKWLLLFLSVLLCWWLFAASATASASGMQETPEKTYLITESELTTLENNLAQLKSTNERLQPDLRVQSNEATLLRKELDALRKELDALRKELDRLRSQSQTQENSLTTANRLLDEYAIEAKRERLRIKAQRNGWAAAAACLAIALAVK